MRPSSCELVWKRLNGEIYERKGPDVDVPATDLLQFLLQRDVGRTQDIGAVEPEVTRAWGYLKSELTRVRFAMPTTVAKVLNLSREIQVSRDDIWRRLASAEGKVIRRAEERETLDAEHCEVKLKLEVMED